MQIFFKFDNYILHTTEFIGCQFEQDRTWNVIWPVTGVGEEAIQKCPGGSEVAGID